MVHFDPDSKWVEALNVSGYVDVFVDGELYSRCDFTKAIRVQFVLNNEGKISRDSWFANSENTGHTADLVSCKVEESSPSTTASDVLPVSSYSEPDEGNGTSSWNRFSSKVKSSNEAPICTSSSVSDKETQQPVSSVSGERYECTNVEVRSHTFVEEDIILPVKILSKRKVEDSAMGISSTGSATGAGDGVDIVTSSITSLKQEQDCSNHDEVTYLTEEEDSLMEQSVQDVGTGQLSPESSKSFMSTASRLWNVNIDNQELEGSGFVSPVRKDDPATESDVLEISGTESDSKNKKQVYASSRQKVNTVSRKSTHSKKRTQNHLHKKVEPPIKRSKVVLERLEKSVLNKQPPSQLFCEFCSKTFVNRRAKSKHFLNPNCEASCLLCKTVHFSQGSLFAHYCCVHPGLQNLQEQFGNGFSEVELKVFRDRSDCPLCLKSISDRGCVQHFDSVHFINQLYSCCVCGTKLSTESSLQEHFSKAHDTERASGVPDLSLQSQQKAVASAKQRDAHQCKYCKKIFGHRSELIAHRKKKQSLATTCAQCGVRLPDQAHLIAHESKMHGIGRPIVRKAGGQVECPICAIVVQNGNILEHFRARHTDDATRVCCVCGAEFRSRRMYLRHCERNHVDEGVSKGNFIQCSVCDKKCESVSDFNTHKAMHWRVCRFCGETFVLPIQLKKHLEEKHVEELLPCDHCDKKFPTLQMLKNHQRNIQFRRVGPCPKCGLMLRSLQKHMKTTHPEVEGEAQCDICGKTLKSEHAVRRHKARNHSGKEFECTICSKVFKNSSCLRRHITTVHFITKLHECHICGKKCTKKYNLKVHMRIHSLSKMFPCSICNQGFNYKASLQSHMRSKHSDHNNNT